MKQTKSDPAGGLLAYLALAVGLGVEVLFVILGPGLLTPQGIVVIGAGAISGASVLLIGKAEARQKLVLFMTAAVGIAAILLVGCVEGFKLASSNGNSYMEAVAAPLFAALLVTLSALVLIRRTGLCRAPSGD